MSDFNIPKMKEIENLTKSTTDKTKVATINNLKTHFIDYILLFFICFILGAFDIFILKRSDNLFTPDYWYHAFTRLCAYVLAIILGLRLGYPKAKDNSTVLAEALEENSKLKKERDEDFGDFLDVVNRDVKIAYWKAKINKEIRKLDKRAKLGYHKYYKTHDKEVLKNYKKKAVTDKDVQKADRYCELRTSLEIKLTDDYINENINYLNVKTPIIYESDFDYDSEHAIGVMTYKTKKTTKTTKSKIASTSLIFTVLIVLIIGCVALDVDKALAEERAVAIVSIIINSIIDIGMTLWKFMSGYTSGEKVVEQEDLRVAIDQNNLLKKYKSWRKTKNEVVE